LWHSLFALVAIFTITGCPGPGGTIRPTGPGITTGPSEQVRQQLAKAKELEDHGDFVSATKIYFDLANETRNASRRMDFDLLAISTLIRGGYIQQARRLLERLPRKNMNPEQGLRYRLQLARIYMVDGNIGAALKMLQVTIAPNIPEDLLKEIHVFKAKAYAKDGIAINAVRQYIMAQNLETDTTARSEHEQAIWQILLGMMPEELERNKAQGTPAVLSGWLELAYYAKTQSHNKPQLDLSLQIWKKTYPNHPAVNHIDELLGGLKDFVSISFEDLNQIALVLPLSGKRFANAAAAVRDGFLAAYFAYPGKKPKIRVHDVGKDSTDLMAVYEKAVNEGAQLVVGPLDKAGVNLLVNNKTKITVPTLALNYTDKDTSDIANIFQFGLSPEDEARQVAERAWLNGYKRAVAIVPKGNWGERVLTAFAKNFQKMDGKLVEFQTYNQRQSDYSLPLRRLLNIDDSEVRFVEIKRIVRRRIEFTPRRRKDADFVFMVARPRQARLLQPQLKFHYASDLPIFATSHVYSGRPNRNADRDMDGISFCDMPWILQPEQAVRLKSMLSRDTQKFDRYRRLYALGIDAFRLLPELARLAKDQYERFEGQTGNLTMDANRRVRRNLSWAKFKRGLPEPIESAPEQIPGGQQQGAPIPPPGSPAAPMSRTL